MSEADNTPRRRPPTIDLTAQEVATEQPDSAAKPSAADEAKDRVTPPAQHGDGLLGRAKPYAIGIIVGAAAVAVIVAGLWIAGFVPVREAAAPSAAVTPPSAAAPATPSAKTADTGEISSRLDKIQQALQTPRPDTALAGRMNAAEVQTKSLGESLAALTRRVDEVAGTAQSALAQAKAAASAAEAAKSAAQTNVQHGDIDALANRIAALESEVKSLSADIAQRSSSSSADDRALRATVAAEALRAAVERGAPYQAELAAVKPLGADANATAALEPFAASGIPSAAALGHELAALVPALRRAAEPEPSDNSFLGRLESHAQRLVRITPLDASAASAGDEHASAIARISSDAARGDIAAALADIAKLPDAARTLADSWVKKAQAREAALAASQRIAADALAALSRPVSQ